MGVDKKTNTHVHVHRTYSQLWKKKVVDRGGDGGDGSGQKNKTKNTHVHVHRTYSQLWNKKVVIGMEMVEMGVDKKTKLKHLDRKTTTTNNNNMVK